MPTYTFRKGDEEKTEVMTFSQREEFLKENPDWYQVLSVPLIVREAKGALAISPDSWKDHLKIMKKGSGKDNNIHV